MIRKAIATACCIGMAATGVVAGSTAATADTGAVRTFPHQHTGSRLGERHIRGCPGERVCVCARAAQRKRCLRGGQQNLVTSSDEAELSQRRRR